MGMAAGLSVRVGVSLRPACPSRWNRGVYFSGRSTGDESLGPGASKPRRPAVEYRGAGPSAGEPSRPDARRLGRHFEAASPPALSSRPLEEGSASKRPRGPAPSVRRPGGA